MSRTKDLTKVNKLYKATLSISLNDGIAGLKMANVANAAQVATGTVYIYFSNKAQLIIDTYNFVREKMNDSLKDYDKNGKEDFMPTFQKLWRNYIQYIIDWPEELFFIEQFVRSPYFKPGQLRQLPGFDPFYHLIEQGKNDGHLSPIRSDLMITHLLGGLNEIVKNYMNDELTLSTEDFQNIYNLSWNSIRR